MAYELIETVEVGSGGASSIEFTSIPQDGVDLVVVSSIRSTSSEYQESIYYQVNGDTAFANYSRIYVTGYNNAVQSSTISSNNSVDIQSMIPGTLATSNTFGNHQLVISNYTSSTDKSFSFDGVSENNATQAAPGIAAGLYSTTSPITSLKIDLFSTRTMAQYSTASLYKIY